MGNRDHQRVTELGTDETETLAERALESEYFDRLESYLAAEYDETVPTDPARALERPDGVHAVTFETNSDATGEPTLAVTIYVAERTVTQATAERYGSEVDGDVELVFPAETAPPPESAVRDMLEPEGESVDVEVTVTDADEITAYTLDTGR